MSNNISEALLKQKIEFMQIELDEFKKKEENFRRTNECLMQALGTNDSTSINSHAHEELKKTNEQLEKEIFELKTRYKDKVALLEKEKQELLLSSKELEYSLKQQRLAMETEKLEIVSQLQKLESDKLAAEQALKSYEHDKSYQQELQKYQTDMKVLDLQRQLELQREESRNELTKARQESDKAIIELKQMYEKEMDSLKNQSWQMQEKLRSQAYTIENMKEESNPKLLEIRIEELENELEYYKSLKPNTSTKKKNPEENDEIFLSSREDLSEIKNSASKSRRNQRPSPDFEIENLILQNERLKLQFDRARLEIDQLSIELDRTRREQIDSENALKNEVKFLIGKLLKAKSKLSAEGELSETVRKESMLSTLRYRSNKSSKYASRCSPIRDSDRYN
ncbi:hypothetical protein SteCoe_28043 [Stentor coeruleus]|uniref:Uncharacterized protein n=1 Tax=Stentor coeruleus TaxID=5963 RepID=A0A1R2B933_9CILI|nr:hypothetical protein SteCoe_28043 [Stentor coeruleus]